MPRGILAWNSHPVRLLILEVTAFAFAISVLVGIIALLHRRMTNDRLKVVTNRTDLAIEWLLLLGEILVGVLAYISGMLIFGWSTSIEFLKLARGAVRGEVRKS